MVNSLGGYSSLESTPTILINHFYSLYSQGNGIEHADSIISICRVIAKRRITDTHLLDKLSRCFNTLAKFGKQEYITKSLAPFAKHCFFSSRSKTFFKLLEQSMGLEPTFIGKIDETFTADSTSSDRIKSETNNNDNIKLESKNNDSIKLESIPATELESIISEAFKKSPSSKISDIFETYYLIKSILNKIGNQQQTESLLKTINPIFDSMVDVSLKAKEWKGVPATMDFINNSNEISSDTKHIYIDKIVDSLCSEYCKHRYDIFGNLEEIYQYHLKHKSYFNLNHLMKMIDLIITQLSKNTYGDQRLKTLTTLIEISLTTNNVQLLDKICEQSTPDELLALCESQNKRLKEPSCTIEEIRLFGKVWCRAILSRFESATNVKYPSSNGIMGSYSYPLERSYTCILPKCECLTAASFLLSEDKETEFNCRLDSFSHIENAFVKFNNFLRYQKNGHRRYKMAITKLQPAMEYLNAYVQEFIDSLTRCRSAFPQEAIGKLSNDDYITTYYRALDNRLNELTAKQPITPVNLPAIPPFQRPPLNTTTTKE
ncbi:hypothetical protein PPL_00900 [Heterostelium album PN500]|uniref:Uncharacterized protein n=1 Tax=Heterostelium pallidum (strain ATCC 26659 / Pp 5 / PN500) TaxID=670386 RepID=D3AYY1_HETP5|nr:hypothetical protein PPL_00900 [Heterostelium album PN500]EFA85671.1 hypothetical protein PPL_00900 [Heterostelium album PN500]|eukprot:XP_020437778.1 hypothetical protein PPL_00900 [Heterostelium album PN500]